MGQLLVKRGSFCWTSRPGCACLRPSLVCPPRLWNESMTLGASQWLRMAAADLLQPPLLALCAGGRLHLPAHRAGSLQPGPPRPSVGEGAQGGHKVRGGLGPWHHPGGLPRHSLGHQSEGRPQGKLRNFGRGAVGIEGGFMPRTICAGWGFCLLQWATTLLRGQTVHKRCGRQAPGQQPSRNARCFSSYAASLCLQAWRAVHPPKRGSILLTTCPMVHKASPHRWLAVLVWAGSRVCSCSRG